MDITEYTQQPSNFLTAKDVVENLESAFVITGEGEFVENKFGNTRLHLAGEFNKERKTFDCSKTNSRIIFEKLGPETKQWIGRVLKFEVYKTRTSDGKMVDAINIKKVE